MKREVPELPEVQRARDLLVFFLQLSEKNRQSLDAEAGQGRGFTSQVITGRVKLRLDHILRLLPALNVTPAVFLGLLYPQTAADRSAISDLTSTLRHRGFEGLSQEEAAAPAPPLQLDDFAHVVGREVERVFLEYFPALASPRRSPRGQAGD